MPIRFDALTDDDLTGIARICKLNPLGWQPSEVIRRIAKDDLSFWKMIGDKAEVRLVLQISILPEGNELLIWGLFGRGLFANIASAVEHCRLVGKHYRCERIVGEVYSKGLMKLYEKLGAKPLCTRYMLEVADGR